MHNQIQDRIKHLFLLYLWYLRPTPIEKKFRNKNAGCHYQGIRENKKLNPYKEDDLAEIEKMLGEFTYHNYMWLKNYDNEANKFYERKPLLVDGRPVEDYKEIELNTY